jgi:hypothetical protein
MFSIPAALHDDADICLENNDLMMYEMLSGWIPYFCTGSFCFLECEEYLTL